MVKYIFNLKSIDVCNEDKATEIAEWTDDGKDDSVYAALGYNFEHDNDGYILFNGEFPHDSDMLIEKQKISEYDIVRILSELRHDFDLYFEGDFSINIDGEITSFDSAGDIINKYKIDIIKIIQQICGELSILYKNLDVNIIDLLESNNPEDAH